MPHIGILSYAMLSVKLQEDIGKGVCSLGSDRPQGESQALTSTCVTLS